MKSEWQRDGRNFRRPRTAGAVGVCLALLMACSLARAAEGEEKEEFPVDPMTGLKMAPDWELVRNHCITCHSTQQFLRQRGTRRTWEDIIRWMQEKGGLMKLDAEIETRIVDYLAANHAPGGEYRRALIPATLMPDNPYVSDARKEYEEKVRQGLVPAK